jgi:hypothetical protein
MRANTLLASLAQLRDDREQKTRCSQRRRMGEGSSGPSPESTKPGEGRYLPLRSLVTSGRSEDETKLKLAGI